MFSYGNGLIESVTMVVPLLAMTTGAVNLDLAFAITVAGFAFVFVAGFQTLNCHDSLQILRSAASRRPKYLEWYRGEFSLATCILILAVDFDSFQSRFAKSESFGTSLMDLGSGGIVFAGGLVSQLVSSSRDRQFSKATLLLMVGLARAILTHVTGYQVEVNEYGRQWNFFITLYFISMIKLVSPSSLSIILPVSLFVLKSYQTMLSKGVIHFIHDDCHDGSLLVQNKEGVYSLVGYWAIHCLSRAVAWGLSKSAGFCYRQAREKKHPSKRTPAKAWLLVWWLFWVSITSIGMFLLDPLESFTEPASRRACNSSYVLWIIDYHLWICLIKVSLQISGVDRQIVLAQAMNQNMFVVFLLANMMTGAVNLSINTQEQGYFSSITILSKSVVMPVGIYCLLLCLVSLRLYDKNKKVLPAGHQNG